MRKYLLLAALLVLSSCGPRGGKTASAPAPLRDFPSVEIPSMYTDSDERIRHMAAHFWDRFTDTTHVWRCDSLTVNGVSLSALEEQVGLYTTLLGMVPLPDACAATDALFTRLERFERHDPATNVFEQTAELVRKYLYDANSPVRNEDIYLPFARRLAASDLIEDGYRTGYGWEARVCALNRTGTPAADFSFIDTGGRRRTLYGVRADYVVLIFGNPGCNACQEIMAAMTASPEITSLMDAGRLKVVDIYIDEEVDEWKARIPEYPADWINGYDPDGTIRRDLVYNVRAIPSLYLLDAAKTVLLKDAPAERLLAALARL